MKTIKQIADEIGVTKQAVHQRIKRKPLSTSLHKHLKTIDGVIYINVEGEEIIKTAFTKRPSIDAATENIDTSTDNVNVSTETLTDIIDGENITDSNCDDEELSTENNITSTINVDLSTENVDTFTTMFTKPVDDELTNNYINSLKEQISLLSEQNKKLWQESNKNREALEREREHSRSQSEKVINLAEQLTELNKNNQVLLREAQEKTAILLPEKFSDNTSVEPEKKKGFFKKRFGKK